MRDTVEPDERGCVATCSTLRCSDSYFCELMSPDFLMARNKRQPK